MSDVWGTERQAPIDDLTATELGDAGDPTASSDDVEARAAEIEQTREEMTETVSAIGDRLDPANIVAGAKETVREATVGKVESMASAAGDVVSDAGSTAQQAGSGIIQTIRHNPIPAALAGIGVGWLLKNRSSGSMSARSSADSWSRQGSSWADRGAHGDRRSGGYGQMGSDDRSASADQSNGAKDKVAQVADSVGQRVGSIGDAVGDRVGSMGDRVGSVGDTVGERVGDIGGAVSQVPGQIGSTAQTVGQQAQRLLKDAPLAFGAVAVAVGAAIGMVLPATETERQMLGSTSEKLIDTAEHKATQVMEQTRSEMPG